MAKPNYGYQKRQKELAKQKKKSERKLKKAEEAETSASPAEEAEQLEQAITDVKQHMLAMDKESDLYQLGEQIIENLTLNPADISLEMARVFLTRASDQP